MGVGFGGVSNFGYTSGSASGVKGQDGVGGGGVIATAGGGGASPDFIMTVETTTASETFTIPCQDVGTFNATVDWGDGSQSAITAFNDADLTHTYVSAGTHTITVSGTFPNIFFNNGGDRLKVRTVENLGATGWVALNNAFYGCSNMASFVSGAGCDTSSVTNMRLMFFGCSGLTSLDVSSFDTSSVTDMGLMFQSCSGLTSLDVSSFDTSSVTNMGSMFRFCSGLTSLDLSSFDTSSVTSMGSMFLSCSGLTSLDVSSFDTSSVTDMGRMFEFCSGLTSLDLSSFDTSSVTSMGRMFQSCSGLTSLDVSSFDTSSVTSMGRMFQSCSGLTDVRVDLFDISGLNSTNDLDLFMRDVTLSTARYDATLIAWAAQTVFAGMSPNFGGSKYTAGGAAETARTSLINDDSWTITDGGSA
jgi:surface protein